jgi:hypothetical protein
MSASDRPSEATIFDHWLFVACVAFGLYSLVWVIIGSFDPLGLWDGLLADAFYDGRTPETVTRFRQFILGPLGATSAAAFLALAMILRFPFRRREPWAFAAVAGALWLWFLVDSAASVYHGAVFNVWLVNLPCVIALTIPLVALYPRFREGHATPTATNERRVGRDQ